MRKTKEIEIIETNEEPASDGATSYFVVTNACADGAGEVIEFKRALEKDLQDVSSKMPGCVDPRVLLISSSDGDSVRLRVKAPYRGGKDLRFWTGVRTERCNALSGKWFSEKWNGRRIAS